MYAAAYVRRYNRAAGTLAEAKSMKTMVYGDVHNFGARLHAGTGSGTGGIQDGDAIPSGAMAAASTAS